MGVSGLIHAYKQAAGDAISNAKVVTRIVEHMVEVFFDYTAMNSLMQLIKEEELEIVNSQFNLQCVLTIKVRSARLEAIETKILKTKGIIDCKIVQE